MTKEKISEKAIELATIHTIIVPIFLMFMFGTKTALGYIVTIFLLQIARQKFDYSEFNRVKAYYFTLIVKVFAYSIMLVFAISEMLKIAAWLIAFYK